MNEEPQRDNSEPTVQELRSAIETAVASARFQIRHAGQNSAWLSTEQVAGLFRQTSTGRLLDRMEVEVRDSGELVGLLLRSRTLRRHFSEDKKFIHFDGSTGFSLSVAMPIERVCGRMVQSALKHSTGVAARALADFLTAGTFPVRTVHLLKGPRIANPIDLDGNCQLVPYATALEISGVGGRIADSPSDTRIPLDANADGCGLVVTAVLRPGASEVMLLNSTAREDVEESARLEYEGLSRFGPDFTCAMLSVVTRRAFNPFCHIQVTEDI